MYILGNATIRRTAHDFQNQIERGLYFIVVQFVSQAQINSGIDISKVEMKPTSNKYFAAVIDHARFLFPTTGHVHESYNTSRKFLDCQVIPK